MPPLPMKTFWPSMTQSSPSLRARVWIERTSLPPLGSVTASAASCRSPGVPKHSGAHWTSCSSVAACRIAASASAGMTIDRPMPAQPQKSSSMRIGSESPVGIHRQLRVELPLVEPLTRGLLDHRPRELLRTVVLGRRRADHIAGERVGLGAQLVLLLRQVEREAHDPVSPVSKPSSDAFIVASAFQALGKPA